MNGMADHNVKTAIKVVVYRQSWLRFLSTFIQLTILLVHFHRQVSIKPLGGLFNFLPPQRGVLKERGLIRDGGVFTESKDKDVYDIAFQLIYSLFCRFTIQFYE